jgi:hypothetical protein
MSIRSEVDRELRGGVIYIYKYRLTFKEDILLCWQTIAFTLFALNITVWSPGMIVLFLCQRTFIDKRILLLIIKMGIGMSFVNAILAYAYVGNGYIRWDSFQHLLQPDALNWISGVKDWWHQNMYFSIILWSIAIGFAALQLIISHFAPSTKEYGYGLLNIPALFTGIKPSPYLTFLQDGILGAFVFHIVGQKQFDFAGKTSMFCFAAIVMFWIVFSAFTLDISRWELYSDKNVEKLTKKREELKMEADRILEEDRQEMMADKRNKAENDREIREVMKEISQYIKEKKQNED